MGVFFMNRINIVSLNTNAKSLNVPSLNTNTKSLNVVSNAANALNRLH